MNNLEEYLLTVDNPEYLKEFYDLKRSTIDHVLIVENFQKLLGVYTTTDALVKIVELMKLQKEASVQIEVLKSMEDELLLLMKQYKNGQYEYLAGCIRKTKTVMLYFLLMEGLSDK